MTINPLQIRELFGNPAPPQVIWEEQFDGFNKELIEMGMKDWQSVTEEELWYYFHDLTYMELQPDLFAHLFPVCLKFWYDTLMRNDSAERGDADLHRSLLRGQILTKMVTPEQRQAIYQFMHDAFIERLENERGFIYAASSTPAYGWMYRFNSIGLVIPIIDRIWDSWWRLDHPGKAVCAIMWASGLIYDEGENPIFGAWTRELGGGGPYLTESDSQIYDSAWLPENLEFLRGTLSSRYLHTKLVQATETLRGEPEHPVALTVTNQAAERLEMLEGRIATLLHDLNTPSADQFI